MGLDDTGQPDDANEAPFSAAEPPGGSTVIWSDDFAYASAADTIVSSSDVDIPACRVEENIMVSSCFAARGGTVV